MNINNISMQPKLIGVMLLIGLIPLFSVAYFNLSESGVMPQAQPERRASVSKPKRHTQVMTPVSSGVSSPDFNEQDFKRF